MWTAKPAALLLALIAAAMTAACSTSNEATPTEAPSPQSVPSGSGLSIHGASPAQAGGNQLAFTATTVDGKPFDGRSLRGKPVVLWFWAAWCPVCAGEAPAVAKAAAANPGVSFVGVSALDQLPAMRKFVTDRGVGGFTNLADPDAAIWKRFGVTSQPAHAFIDASGAVTVVPGALSYQELTDKINVITKF